MADALAAGVAGLSASATAHLTSVPNLIGYGASLITGAQVTRQILDVWRVPNPVGVSWITWDLALVQSIGLLAFSVARGYAAASIINAWVGLASLVILARILTTRQPPRLWPWLTVGATLAVSGIWPVLLGTASAGVLGAVASAFVWVPQAVRSIRMRSPAGLSWPFVLAGLASSALWIVYAVLIGQWRLLVPPVSAIGSLIVTAAYALWGRSRSPAGPPEAESSEQPGSGPAADGAQPATAPHPQRQNGKRPDSP
jgi:uncharacterized protein with PQ loop repeat